MSKLLKHCFMFTIAGLLLAHTLMGGDGINGNLVTAQWLKQHLNDSNLLLLDASPVPVYAVNHIPGAVSVNIFALYGREEASLADTEKLLQSWGVSPGKRIVMYDQGGSMMATRVFFSLYSHGFPAEDLLILDGGFFQWQQRGLPLTKESTPVAKLGAFQIQRQNKEDKAELPEVLTASGDPTHNVLLDALDPDWYFGEVLALTKPGHIPHGILLPNADFYNSDRTFKSPEEITRMLAYFHVRPEQQIYTYCGGGVAASVPWFALKFILNYPAVKLYTGSELDWLSDERELPYWTYDAPFLMRESNWLQFWSGQMPRAVGIAHVSIVDVRPGEAFRQGHVPFASNVPREVFQSSTTNPGKLAETLGQAGVNASDEAIVISGAGLTPDAALAFVVLEKLGQKRVSVLMDSMDEWAHRGFSVTKEATAAGSSTYRGDLRQDILIADANSTRGVYPKVFIASGKDVPEKAPDGTVIHVAYTDLLNSDGTPKPARDIWKTLVKAGVPRYAELVCIADDPGEAAVNYFVLKLMGYPDVKLLAR